MKKILHYIPLILIVAITVTLFVKINTSDKQSGYGLIGNDVSPMLGKKMPDMELELLASEKGKLNPESFKTKGEYTAVNLFASWCIGCLYEHKLISSLKENKGLRVVGIAWRDETSATKQWLKQYGNPYDTVAQDSQGKYGIMLGVTGIPETFLVDPDGVIVAHIRGSITEGHLLMIKDIVKQ